MSPVFVPTLTILAALQTQISALKLADGTTPAFAKVVYYDKPDLLRALQELRVFDNRLCLIVPDGDRYENTTDGRVINGIVHRSIILLLADRQPAVRQAASTGDAQTPGVIALNEIVVGALYGSDLGLASVRVLPEHATPVQISDANRRDLPGREAWSLDLTVTAGRQRGYTDPRRT